jgi:hypothetical protein
MQSSLFRLQGSSHNPAFAISLNLWALFQIRNKIHFLKSIRSCALLSLPNEGQSLSPKG